MVDERWLQTQLEKDGVLGPEGLAAARERQRLEGGDLAHNLLEVGAVDESAVLRAISIAHRTRYVTAEKLARARIADTVLARIPVQLAETYLMVPIQFDEGARAIAVVMADPSPAAIEAAKHASSAQDVRAYVALPESVEAAIRRFYRGDAAAFLSLEERLGARHLDVDSHPAIIPSSASTPPSGSSIGTAATLNPIPRLTGTMPPTVPASSTPTPTPSPPANTPTAEFWQEVTQPIDIREARTTTNNALAKRAAAAASDAWTVPIDAYLETLKTLVSVSEMASGSWRQGHTAEVAREARRLAQRIGLGENEQAELVVAAFLHDVGKPDEPHLTLLGISAVPEQRAIAERAWSTPSKLFEGAQLPVAVLDALASMYERVDGQGLPRRRRGRDIPLGARILAVVDAFVELTKNPFGAAGGNVADSAAAIATLRRHADTLFDGNLVEILSQVTSGDDLRQRLLGERGRVLIADADAEATSVLELKLVAEGFEVRVARSSHEALRAMAQWTPDLVVSEVALAPVDGFALLEEARKHKRTYAVPFFFVSERASAADLDRGFALGAADYLSKPYPVDMILVKIRRLVTDRARSREATQGRRVLGSLGEMGVSDILEVLSKGGKSGALRLRAGEGGSGPQGDLWLDGGKIVHAACPPDAAGQEALFRLLALREGEFTFEAGAPAPTRSIDAATEWLLLEGMRRLDEGDGR